MKVPKILRRNSVVLRPVCMEDRQLYYEDIRPSLKVQYHG